MPVSNFPAAADAVPDIQADGKRRWLALAVLLTGNFVTILDLFIVNVAIPNLRVDLAASDAQIQLVLVGYSAAYGICLMNGARLGDLFGRRRIFLVGMALFTLASALCGVSPESWFLVASRAVEGIGAALLMPQVLASVRLLFQGETRRRAFGIMGAVQGVAASISQLVGGWLIEHAPVHMGWRMVFLINLPIGLLALWGGRAVLPTGAQQSGSRLDLVGAGAGALGLGLVLVPIMLGREYGWPGWALMLPMAGILVLLAFWQYEKRLLDAGGSPMFDVTLFHQPGFLAGAAAIFLLYSSISSFFLSLTLLLQAGLGLAPLAAGLVFTPSAVAFFAGSLAGPRLAMRLDHRALLPGVCLFIAGLAVSAWVGAHAPAALGLMVLGLVLNGAGQGVVIPLALNALLGQVRDHHAGAASGAIGTLQAVGTSVGVTLVGVIFFSALDHASGAVGYGDALAHATVYNLAASALSLLLFAYALR
ncbi:MAG: MFS transporter [Thiomonas sp. 13-66-29]|nr:MAG: MFS transporter [Thiomonas sp. 13-66-29]